MGCASCLDRRASLLGRQTEITRYVQHVRPVDDDAFSASRSRRRTELPQKRWEYFRDRRAEWHSRVTDRPVKLSRLSFVRTTYLFAVLIAMAGWTWLLFSMVAAGIDFFD